MGNKLRLFTTYQGHWQIFSEKKVYPKLNSIHVSEIVPGKDCRISSEMTVLEVIHRHRQTETVFKKYDEQAGICICCQALFDTLEEVAGKYNLGLKGLLLELEAVAGPGSAGRNEFGS